MEKGKVDPTLHKFVKNLTYTVLLVFVAISALSRIIGNAAAAQFAAVVAATGTRRVDLVMGVSYADDLKSSR